MGYTALSIEYCRNNQFTLWWLPIKCKGRSIQSNTVKLIKGTNMVNKLIAEIEKIGAAACLPRNLSDELLTHMEKEFDQLEARDDSGAPSCVLLGLIIILSHRAGRKEIKIPAAEFHTKMEEYRMEIAFEKISRVTDIKYEPATLETIFKNRELKVWKEEMTFH